MLPVAEEGTFLCAAGALLSADKASYVVSQQSPVYGVASSSAAAQIGLTLSHHAGHKPLGRMQWYGSCLQAGVTSGRGCSGPDTCQEARLSPQIPTMVQKPSQVLSCCSVVVHQIPSHSSTQILLKSVPSERQTGFRIRPCKCPVLPGFVFRHCRLLFTL